MREQTVSSSSSSSLEDVAKPDLVPSVRDIADCTSLVWRLGSAHELGSKSVLCFFYISLSFSQTLVSSFCSFLLIVTYRRTDIVGELGSPPFEGGGGCNG